jgi:hypothetical protein
MQTSVPASQKPITVTADIYKLSMMMEEYVIHSDVIGDDIKVDISYLEGIKTKSPRPSVYITDGNWHRKNHKYIHSMSTLNAIPQMLAIGVGYPQGYEFGKIRWRDLWNSPEAFLRCLKTEVIPFVEKRFPADPAKRILFGGSLGGSFILSSFLNNAASNDATFSGFIGSSSYLINSNHFLLATKLAEKQRQVPFNLFLTYGGNEGVADYKISNKKIFSLIEKPHYEGLNFIYCENPGKDHYSNTRATFADGIKLFLGTEEYKGIGFQDITATTVRYNFSAPVQVFDWFYDRYPEYGAFSTLAFNTDNTDSTGDKGCMKAVCDFTKSDIAAGALGTVFDHTEDLANSTIEFNVCIPEALANRNYSIRFYIQSTPTPEFWTDESPALAIQKSGWNRFAFTWNKTKLKGNARLTREVGIIIQREKGAPAWAGDIYFDEIKW